MRITKGTILMFIVGLAAACGTSKQTLSAPTKTLLRDALTSRPSLVNINTSTPIPSNTPVVTIVSSPTLLYTPIAISTPTPVICPLVDFPLNVGNTWAYHYYSYYEDKSVEYSITVKVVSTQILSGYFVAEMYRDNKRISGDLADVILTPPPQGRYWYIVDRGRVYIQQGELNPTNVDTIWLEYVLPLSENPCFYRYSGMREDFTQASTDDPSGRGCTWVEGPIEKETMARKFENCYWIVTPDHAGGFQEWFCPGIGFVGDKYDHRGTPYGDETTLVDFDLSGP